MDAPDETRDTPSAIEQARLHAEERLQVSESRCRLLAENASERRLSVIVDTNRYNRYCLFARRHSVD